MVFFEELQGAQGFDAGSRAGGVGEFTGSEGMFVDGDRGFGLMLCIGSGSGMVMRLVGKR